MKCSDSFRSAIRRPASMAASCVRCVTPAGFPPTLLTHPEPDGLGVVCTSFFALILPPCMVRVAFNDGRPAREDRSLPSTLHESTPNTSRFPLTKEQERYYSTPIV